MGYESDMDEWYDELKMKKTFKATYTVPAGTYEAPTLWRLCWEVFKHRLHHLIKHGRWMD